MLDDLDRMESLLISYHATTSQALMFICHIQCHILGESQESLGSFSVTSAKIFAPIPNFHLDYTLALDLHNYIALMKLIADLSRS